VIGGLRRRVAVLPHLGRLARWTAPSLAGACAGALAGGLLEGLGADGALALGVTAGFFALVAIPALFAGGVVARGVVAAWRPRELAARLVEPGGGAPRLAGWLAVLWLGTCALAWIVHGATWRLARRTDLAPAQTSVAEPLIAIAAAAALGAVSRPAARLFAALARRLDARWRSSGRGTLLRPRALLAAAAVLTLAATYAAWRAIVKPRLGPLDTSPLYAPALAAAVAWLAHAARRRIARRAAIGAAACGLGAAAIATALAARWASPAVTLEVWGERPLAGFAIERVFDLEAIRATVSLAEFRPIDRPGAPHPDILLITIDTLRADHTPPYGGAADMPVLRGLADRGAVFTWAFAPSNVTRRSIPSLAIGLDASRVRGRVVGWALRVDPRHVLLAERLRAAGYETAGFMCCHSFWGAETRTGLSRGLEHLVIERMGGRLAALARRWLEDRERRGPDRPLFLWMHILEPHNWTAGVGEPRTVEERTQFYDRSLAASDAMVGEVLAPLAARPPERAPIAIVTADHGEALGDHGHAYHSTDLYNSQMRVPLVVAGPGIGRQAIPETVSLVDLVPTIVELAGYEPPRGPAIDGRSLAPLLRGRQASRPETGTAFAAMIQDRSNRGGVTAVVKGRWKLLDIAGVLELYDIHADPDEREDLAARRPEIVADLRALLEDKRAAARRSPFD